jgi:hypothetical protein
MWRSILLLPCFLLPFAISALGGPVKVLDAKFSHLRNAEPREWSRFSTAPDSDRIKVVFDLDAPESFRLLTLRQEETKQPWEVQLNGQKLTTLPRDHNHLEHGVAIPAGLLKASGNVLEISTGATEADDVRLGDLALHDAIQVLVDGEREEILFQQRGFRRALPPMSATVTLKAVEAETGETMPCRFTILDADTGALVFVGAESDDRIAVREGIVYTLDGEATIRLAGSREHPRRYQVYCGRGFEYSLSQEEIVIDADDAKVSLDFALRREVPTPGLVACDPHLHTFQFDRHGDCNLSERLLSIAGEGIELPVSTAHDKHIDYREEASRIGADRWFTPVAGCEVTTSLGHFNAFPVEPGSAPAAHKMRPWPDIFQNIYGTPGVRVCILNHGRDLHSKYRPFDPENFDPATGSFRHGWKLETNAMELINSGAQKTDPMQLVHDWFALLKSGHKIAGIGSSDSHTVNFAIPGQSRTYLEAADETPGAIDVDKAIDSLVAGRTWVCFGLLTRLDLDAEKKTVTARVLGPGWTTADRLRIFRDGEEIFSVAIPEESGKSAGEKYAKEFSLSDLLPTSDGFLCAVATGPGITGGWWPIMPPYQPDSPDFDPFVMGISPALHVK